MGHRGRSILAAFLLAFATGATAVPGERDPSFAANGLYVDPLECCGWSQATAVVALPDGRALVAGSASDGTRIDAVVFRLNADGSLDSTFGIGGVVRLPASLNGSSAVGLERQPDGRIVVAGESSTATGARPFIARLDAQGLLDPSFGSSGIVALASFGIGEQFVQTRGVALQPDGRIVIAGSVSFASGGGSSFFVARVTAAGALDTGFGFGGVARNETPFMFQHYRAYGVAIASDGGIVVAGDWEEFGLGVYPAAAKFTAAGALDAGFSNAGVLRLSGRPGGVRAITALADGRLLLAGKSSNNAAALYQLMPNGALDTSYNGTGIATIPIDPSSRAEATGVVVDADGYRRVLVAESPSSNYSGRVRRISPAGVVDPLPADAPADLEVDTAYSPPRMAAGPSGTLYIAASNRREIAGFDGMPTVQPVLTALVARMVGPGGTPDPAWGNQALPGAPVTAGRAYPLVGVTQPRGEYDTISVDGTGNVTLLRQGSCAPFASPGCARLTRLLPNGQVDAAVDHVPTSAGTAGARLLSAVVANGEILVAGATSGSPGSWTLRRLNADGTLDTGFTSQTLANGDPSVYWREGVLAVYPDNRILFGSDARLRRFLPDGQVDGTFNAGNELFDASMTAVATRSSGGFAVARDFLGGQVQLRDASGALDTSFGQNGVAQLFAGGSARPDHIAFQADGKIVVAGRIIGIPTASDTPFVARLTAAGALDTSFGAGGIVRMPLTYEAKRKLAGLVVQPDGKIVFGGTDVVTSPPYRGWVARLNPDGAPDAGFGIGGVAVMDPSSGADTVSALALHPDGGILVGGSMGGRVSAINGPTLQMGPFYVMKLQAQGGGRDIAPGALPVAGLSRAYSVPLSATGGSGPNTFTVASGSLPPGLTLSNGLLGGVPTLAGTFTFTIRSSDANGTTATRAYTLPVHSSQTLVASYYATILGRAPDAGGAAFWPAEVARMAQLGASTSEAFYSMAAQFFASVEYAARYTSEAQYLSDLYRTFFDRDPDPSGMEYWLGELAAGKPRGAVLNDFLFSAEFAGFMDAIFGPAATSRAEVSMVLDFYRGLLGRLPDTGGLQYWVGRFRAAQCNGTVVAEVDAVSSLFVGSAEYANRQAALPAGNRASAYVIDLYNAFLKRGGDRLGVQYWVSQITSGAQTNEQVRRAFRDSPEFQGRVSAVLAAGCMPAP